MSIDYSNYIMYSKKIFLNISNLLIIMTFFILSFFKYFLSISIHLVIKVLLKNKISRGIMSAFSIQYKIFYSNICYFINLDK